jgi:hypothetical protein
MVNSGEGNQHLNGNPSRIKLNHPEIDTCTGCKNKANHDDSKRTDGVRATVRCCCGSLSIRAPIRSLNSGQSPNHTGKKAVASAQ